MKWLVLLAGCGLGDGSCVEEVILTYTALDKYHCDYTPVAENIAVPAVNHMTEEIEGSRLALVEAARIGRGRIKDIRDVDLNEYNALLIPGGIGLISSYQTSSAVKTCVEHFVAHQKPIGTMCAGIDFLHGLLGWDLLQEKVTDMTATNCYQNGSKNIYYTPAFKKTASCYDVMLGIDAMMKAMLEDWA